MPRLLFEKKGNAVWISHLDLMRVFQRSFKRAGLPLTHTQGFNPRPSVSIALPLSVGIESSCELLDFDLDGEKIALEEIRTRLNAALIHGVTVLRVYDDCKKLKSLAFLNCTLSLEYNQGIPEHAAAELAQIFRRQEIIVTKKNKNGESEQDIVPMLRRIAVRQSDEATLSITARICCQNPTLNPMQLIAAIEKYAPAFAPDFVTCTRDEVYDTNEEVFR